jgi:hypothetical protein
VLIIIEFFFFVNEIMVKSWEYGILGCEF